MAELLLYGIRGRPHGSRVLRLSCGIGLVSLLAASFFLTYDRVRWYHAERIQALLENVSSVQSVKLAGFDDGPGPWKVVNAELSLEGFSQRKITLFAPNYGDLLRGVHIRVERIGNYTFLVKPTPNDGPWMEYLDVGKDGQFSGLLSIELQDVGDVVALYDTIVNALNRLPRKGVHRNTNGELYEYEIFVDP